MKSIKYIAIMLLAAATMACQEVGTVGKTSVGFAGTTFEEGFSLGTVYVPLTIEAEEGGENTADVELLVDVIATDNCTEIELKDGQLVDGDFMITAHDMVFRAGVKEIGIEVEVFNPGDKNEYSFTLEIVSSNTAIDKDRKQCVVTIKKDARDAMAGTYKVTGQVMGSPVGWSDNSFYNGQEFKLVWNNSYDAFTMPSTFAYMGVDAPLVFYFNAETSVMTMPAVNMVLNYSEENGVTIEEFFGSSVDGVDPSWDVAITTRVMEFTGQNLVPCLNDVVMVTDMEKSTISFPSGKNYAIAYCLDFADSQGTVKSHYAPASAVLINPVWTKQ